MNTCLAFEMEGFDVAPRFLVMLGFWETIVFADVRIGVVAFDGDAAQLVEMGAELLVGDLFVLIGVEYGLDAVHDVHALVPFLQYLFLLSFRSITLHVLQILQFEVKMLFEDHQIFHTFFDVFFIFIESSYRNFSLVDILFQLRKIDFEVGSRCTFGRDIFLLFLSGLLLMRGNS